MSATSKRWALGCLRALAIFLIVAVVLLVLLYAEEDWRGARELAAAKANWQAAGYSLNPADYYPPPVPDDKNLAAIPLLRLEERPSPPEYPNRGTILVMPVFDEALQLGGHYLEIPTLAGWMRAESPDWTKIGETLANNFQRCLPGQKPPDNLLAQFDVLFPFTSVLRQASETSDLFRYNVKYDFNPPFFRPLGPLMKSIEISRLLTSHALLALHEKRSDLALEDVQTNLIVLSGIRRDPSLIGGLVAVGISTINLGAVYYGLAQREWSDEQLQKIEGQLQQLDFLSDFQFSVQAEVTENVDGLDFFKQVKAKDFPVMAYETTYAEARWGLWPGGWWDSNASKLIGFHSEQLMTVDPKRHLVFSKTADEMRTRAFKLANSWTGYLPWNVWFTEAAMGESDINIKFAEAQVWADETRIACGLERYRLAHGAYPSTLDVLAPQFIAAVPHDVMNGESYHYKLNGDGTFLLYSVGWNGTDEGGKVVFQPYNNKVIDFDQGDWVWPMVKR